MLVGVMLSRTYVKYYNREFTAKSDQKYANVILGKVTCKYDLI